MTYLGFIAVLLGGMFAAFTWRDLLIFLGLVIEWTTTFTFWAWSKVKSATCSFSTKLAAPMSCARWAGSRAIQICRFPGTTRPS